LELVDSQDCVFSGKRRRWRGEDRVSDFGRGAEEADFLRAQHDQDCSTWGAQVQGEAGKASAMYFYGEHVQRRGDEEGAEYAVCAAGDMGCGSTAGGRDRAGFEHDYRQPGGGGSDQGRERGDLRFYEEYDHA
jgi:hypothetical protein